MKPPKFNRKNKPSEEIEKITERKCQELENKHIFYNRTYQKVNAILEYLDWKWEQDKR